MTSFTEYDLIAKAEKIIERANLIESMYKGQADSDVPMMQLLAIKAEAKAGGMVDALEMLIGIKVKYTEKRGYYIAKPKS